MQNVSREHWVQGRFICPGRGISPSQGTIHTHLHLGKYSIANPTTSINSEDGRNPERPKETHMWIMGGGCKTPHRNQSNPGVVRLQLHLLFHHSALNAYNEMLKMA